MERICPLNQQYNVKCKSKAYRDVCSHHFMYRSGTTTTTTTTALVELQCDFTHGNEWDNRKMVCQQNSCCDSRLLANAQSLEIGIIVKICLSNIFREKKCLEFFLPVPSGSFYTWATEDSLIKTQDQSYFSYISGQTWDEHVYIWFVKNAKAALRDCLLIWQTTARFVLCFNWTSCNVLQKAWGCVWLTKI